MFYTCYKITKLINSKIYVGVHKTNNKNDGYMGSGVAIKKAITKYGINNFKKEIIKTFETLEEMLEFERNIVDEEFVKCRETYNLTLGGGSGIWSVEPTIDMLACKDNMNNIYHISKKDPRYLSGELIPIRTGYVSVKDGLGNTMAVKTDDIRYLSGELKYISCGTVNVKDKTGKTFRVSIDDPRYLSGELISASKDIKKRTFIHIDENNNKERVSFDDPRYLSGEVINSRKGKVCAVYNGENIIVSVDDVRFKTGELVNLNKNKITVINKETQKTQQIDKLEYDDRIHSKFGVGEITCFDIEGNKYRVSIDDPRYLSGELKAKTTKNQVTVKDIEGNTFNISVNDPRYLSGELKSVNSGTITINNGKEMKRIPKDSDIPIGWVRGMIKRIL